jgi:uroporphyrinogen decarboxylase
MEKRQRFLAALTRQRVDRPPVWLMRQAGRYLPGYRAVRAEHGFWDVCQTPELSTRVALEPLRLFPLDAAIVFSDILVIPQALGAGVTFEKGEGPVFTHTLKSRSDLASWNTDALGDRIAYLPRAVRHLSQSLAGSHGILGFAGAPFTLFAYSVEGGGSDDFRKARSMLATDPTLAADAMGIFADAAAELCLAQLDAGADAVQLFDTWGGLLTKEDYRSFALPALNRAAAQIRRSGKPVILFVKGGMHLLEVLKDIEVDGVSLDWRTSFTEARRALAGKILQGNLDPVLLFANETAVREKTRALLAEIASLPGGPEGCIVNLGHGILPGTPEPNVAALCNEVTTSANSRTTP